MTDLLLCADECRVDLMMKLVSVLKMLMTNADISRSVCSLISNLISFSYFY